MGATMAQAVQFLPHLAALKRYAGALTRDRGEADDLVQETWQRALKAVGNGQAVARPRAYLMSVMHNLRMDQLRRLGREPETIEADGEVLQSGSASPDLKVTCQQVLAAIAGLRQDYREVLLMAGPGEMTCAEMAALLNIPLGTVLSRLSRARALLRQVLGWDGMGRDLCPA